MDIPYNLKEGAAVVSGLDEFKQTLLVLFQNEYGSFMQSRFIGSEAGLHTDSYPILQQCVENTVSQVPNTVIKDLHIEVTGVNKYKVNLIVTYRGDVVEFSFSI